MVVAGTRRYSPVEYLRQEDQAEFRSELIEGEMILMAGASANQNRIALNFCRLFPLELGNQSYEVFMSDMRVWLPQYESYTYPDVLVVSGTPKFTDQTQKALTNPCLIVEVLSDSMEGYDKTAKFKLYRSILELSEYILVDQTAYRVEQYTKVDDHQWLLTDWVGEDEVLPLRSVAVEITMQDLYKRVVFGEAASESSERSLKS